MGTHDLEALEGRRMLSAAAQPADYRSELLNAADVGGVLSRAGSQARQGQVIVVVDREGVIRGAFARGAFASKGRRNRVFGKAIARARTAALFASTQDAFTTRTARFIVQDHFPHPVQNTAGGPLYGVEFSSLPDSDVLPAAARLLPPGATPLNISGDPGGVPLFKDGIPVGGIGVAGDRHDVAVRRDLIGTLRDPDNPRGEFFNGQEERDLDEAVALAGAAGFLAPREIRADRIFVDGLRLPFTADDPASSRAVRDLATLVGSGDGSILVAPTAAVLPAFPVATIGGVGGELKNTAAPGFGIVASDDPQSVKLSAADVRQVIADAVSKAITLRGAIREPPGVAARVHVAVVDRDGDLLGVFRMGDGTNFSFDVAVQKARTAAYFSDDAHAFSTRAIGFMAQAFFAPGIKSTGPGPLFKLQNELSLNPGNRTGALANGITIFPGGVPLYKNGVLVGAVGVSGDGVDQDDLIAFTGASRLAAPKPIRSDHLGEESVVGFIAARIGRIVSDFAISAKRELFSTRRIAAGLDDIRLPYVKFPRDPDL
jgi:uncharacterized protein GlcG (DUF336 family)